MHVQSNIQDTNFSEEMDDDGSRWDVYFLTAESQVDITLEALFYCLVVKKVFFAIKGSDLKMKSNCNEH